jgi:hypothetical protein
MHRVRMSFPLLSSLSVREAMDRRGASTVDDRAYALTVRANAPLDQALERMADAEVAVAKVEEGGSTIGLVSYRGALTTYRQMLQRGVRRARSLPESSLIVETRLRKTSCLVGQTLRSAAFPRSTLVASITRDGEMLFPHADTMLEAGDVVTVVTEPTQAPQVRALAEGRAFPDGADPAQSALSREVEEARADRQPD